MQIKAVIKAGAKQNLVTQISETEYKISVKGRAIDGKANTDVTKVLADYFDIPKSNIQILKGITNKYKTIEIKR